MSTALASCLCVIRDRWRSILWGALIAFDNHDDWPVSPPQAYRSNTTVFVRTPGDVSRVIDGGDLYDGGAQRATPPWPAAQACPPMSSPTSASTASRRPGPPIKASNPPGTALIDVSVVGPSGAEAQQTATVFLSEYAATVHQLESVPGSLVPRAELVVVDPPSQGVREVAWGLPIMLVLLGAALIGVVLGATAAVLRSIFGPRDGTAGATDSGGAHAKHPEVMS